MAEALITAAELSKPSADSEAAAGAEEDFLSGLQHSCQVRLLYATLGFFFCKVAGKIPGRGLRFFGLI